MTQKEIRQKFGEQVSKAPVYEKSTKVWVEIAPIGYRCVTVTSDGKETENIAKFGDLVVTNQTEAQEKYLLSWDKFKNRYFPVDAFPNSSIWEFQAIGKIRAIEVDEFVLANIGESFIASWGEPMVVKIGDYLATPYREDGYVEEIYRIAKKEFFETYKPFDYEF